MDYSILEHTSDLYIEGRGDNLENALENLAFGMFQSMGNANKSDLKIKIKSKGYDLEIMIVELFSKIISECESESVIPKKMKVLSLNQKKNEIEIEISGEKGFLENIIKAATYHLFSIEKKNNQYIVRMLFDI
ncbi:MAG: archease [Candidatus ainarchaeum sp.]|nr:archease [Candidatus ainarchaeum sp.]